MDENLATRVGRIITRYNMLSPGDSVGVAVSGGADSVVLLHLLHRLSLRLGVHLKVLHVNHALRGRESEDDQDFVQQLAQSLQLKCRVEHAPVPNGNLEQEARLLRRAFFKQCIEQGGLNRIALGHTRSDQAETVLFRLLRGTGSAGFAGMRKVTGDGLIRPLLTTSRAEVRRWAEAECLSWREDSSNAVLEFSRNRLRQEILPTLTTHFNPNLEGVLTSAAEIAQDEEDYWFQLIEPIYQSIAEQSYWGLMLRTDALASFHTAVQRRVMRRALLAVRGDLRSLNKEHIDAILAISTSGHGHDRVMVPGVDALRSFDRLLLRRPVAPESGLRHYRLGLKYDEPCELPFGAGHICVKRITTGTQNCANFKKDWELCAEAADLNEELLAESYGCPISLAVRNWEPGDQLQRPGHRQPEKIKTLFQEERVLLWERRHWPVIVAGDEVVWVRQFGSGAKYVASEESSQRVRVTYQRFRE